MNRTAELTDFVLAMADDKHLIGQQHAEWIGVTPFLEEDLAFCSIGQDELGHAALLFDWLVGDDDIAIDRAAYGRTASEYRSSWFVEMPTTDWEEALVRHWLFDEADVLRWSLLRASSDTQLAEIAARVEREESFHRRHASGIVDALMADDVARNRLVGAARRLAPKAISLFVGADGEDEAVASGVTAAPFSSQVETWKTTVEGRFGLVDWPEIADQPSRRERSEHFEPLMLRMREVLDLDTNAVW